MSFNAAEQSLDFERMYVPNLATSTPLGRTGEIVRRIGIGGGSGMSSDVLAYAIDQGVNYVFHSTDLQAGFYARSQAALKRFVRKGSRKREQIMLAAAS